MAHVFLILNNNGIEPHLRDAGFETAHSAGSSDEILTHINHFLPDIILVDDDYENMEYILRHIKSENKNSNAQIILISKSSVSKDLANLIDGIVESPIKLDVLMAEILSHLKIKKSLDMLIDSNRELSRSLYQINVLYNTSSQFAGTLNANKLYEIMIEALEKTLSIDISALLIFDNNKKPHFLLNTIHTPADNLISALKIRSILNYSSILENPENKSLMPQDSDFMENFSDIEVTLKTKQARSNRLFGLDTISFDSLFAPIKIGEDIFGVIELFREIPYSKEDIACFQAIIHQVALPLKNVKFYEELSQTNKKLEKLEKLKSEFISIVSHELRTPLTPINSSLDIVLSETAGEISQDAKNFIRMAKTNIQRLSGIIEDLLDLSRIETGKFDYKYKITDITQSLELLKNTFSQVANEKNITINLDIKQKLPEIYADLRRIEQIFSNLVSNALKFTPENGTITVTADIVQESQINPEELVFPTIKPKGEYIKITVSDNGIGIKKEDIPKIFDKFSQIESSLNRNKGGVGLGLTITKQLIDAHQGAIWVESHEKEGAKFNVILPLKDDKKIYKMDFSRSLVKNDDVGLIKIKSKKEYNLIQTLKEMKMINPSTLSKELMFDEGEYAIYSYFLPKVALESFSAILKTIQEYCTKIKKSDCDIILSSAHSAQRSNAFRAIMDSLEENK